MRYSKVPRACEAMLGGHGEYGKERAGYDSHLLKDTKTSGCRPNVQGVPCLLLLSEWKEIKVQYTQLFATNARKDDIQHTSGEARI